MNFLQQVLNSIMLIITVVLLCIVSSAFGQWYDFTGKNQKWTVLFMGKELVSDTKRKVLQTIAIRKEHGRFMSYEVGFVIGQIREKYKLMMELYRICFNRRKNYINLQTPKIEEYKSIYYVRKQELILFLAREIDKLIDVLEQTNLPVEPFPSLLEGHILRSRMGLHQDIEEKQKVLEEAVKSRMREQYLLKKMNFSVQSTTKKRFINQWPVQGTWSLETY